MHEKGLGFKAGYTLFDHYSETPREFGHPQKTNFSLLLIKQSIIG